MARFKSEANTESESRLVTQSSENATNDNHTASMIVEAATALGTSTTSIIKEKDGYVSTKWSAKHKSSAKLNNCKQ